MMYRLLITVMCVACPVFAQTPEMLFVEANQLYQQGDFAGARDIYGRIHAGGYASSELYFNLGNAHYKLGAIPRAILSYERAIRLDPSDDDARYNLQLANLLLTDKIEATPRLFLWDYWDAIKATFSPTLLTVAGYGFLVLSVIAASLLVISRSYVRRRVWFIAASSSGVLMILCAALLFATVADRERSDTAIVTTTVTTIKNAPDGKSSDAFVLHGGAKVLITDHVDEWMKIRLADGKVGWMERDAAEII